MKLKFKFWYFEVLLIVMFFVGASSPQFNPPIKNPDYVPNAITGLATMSGIMTAFTGYLITYIIERLTDTPKEWLSKRIIVVVFSMGIGLLFVMIGLSQLVFGSMETAYYGTMFGTILVILPFFEIMFMVIVKELTQITDMSVTFTTE